jgi:DNA-binding transcriptional MerR regulator
MRRTRTLAEAIAAIPPEGLSLESLAETASDLLPRELVAPRDGRIADRVDARTVRFYQTLGILPKPRYAGRRASYGQEHLVRVLAAKQLQAEGYSLAQIQVALPQRTTEELIQALTRLDEAGVAAPPAVASGAPRATTLFSVRLAEGVTLLIDPACVADPHHLALLLARAIDSAAAPPAHPQEGSR